MRRGRIAILTVIALAGTMATAHAAWREFPDASEVADFAWDVDSALVWSVGLPDSAEYEGKRGIEIFDVVHVRERARMPRAWARKFARTMVTRRHLEGRCRCGLVKRPSDTTDVIVPVAKLFVNHEVMWVVIPFRDSCSYVFLQQGNWGTARLDESRSAVLAMFQAALPGEGAFAKDSFPPVPPRQRDTLRVDRNPEVIEKTRPNYPKEAIEKGISGLVWVRLLVGEDGLVQKAVLDWSIPPLDEAALSAAKKWRFTPAMSGGKPVAMWVRLPVKFTLR